MSAGRERGVPLKRNNWLFGCRRISPLEVNGHQMFASAGEEARVPVRAQRERWWQKERQRGEGGRGTEEGPEVCERADRGDDRGTRKGRTNGESTIRIYHVVDQTYIYAETAPRCLTSAVRYFACAKCIWGTGPTRRFPKQGDLSFVYIYIYAFDPVESRKTSVLPPVDGILTGRCVALTTFPSH